MKNKYLLIAYIGWCGIGFLRGVNSYKYTYNNNYKNAQYLYSDSIIFGTFGTFLYANPILFPLMICKELYRLEVNIRKLEREKSSNYYNSLLF
jgi:hypothetical protein